MQEHLSSSVCLSTPPVFGLNSIFLSILRHDYYGGWIPVSYHPGGCYVLLCLLSLFFLKKNYCYSITVVCLFSPSLHPTPVTSLPHLHTPPWFCPCVLYSSSCNPLSSLSLLSLFFTKFVFSCNLHLNFLEQSGDRYGLLCGLFARALPECLQPWHRRKTSQYKTWVLPITSGSVVNWSEFAQ